MERREIPFVLAFAAAAWGLSCGKSAAADGAGDGAAIFAGACARCHGVHGRGPPAGVGGAAAPRDLTDPAFLAQRTDAELRAAIGNGKGGAMPPFGAVYTSAEIDALVVHVRRLGRKER